MLALAKHFSRKGAPRPKRNLLFIGTSGHHVRPPQTAFSAGATDVLKHHADIFKKILFVLNFKHFASINTYVNSNGLVEANNETPLLVKVLNKSPLLLSFLNETIDRYGIPVITRTNQLLIGDPLPFYYAGLNVVHLIAGGLWYHTTGDMPNEISVSGLERSEMHGLFFGQSEKDLSR